MRLLELEPEFVKLTEETPLGVSFDHVEDMTLADGLWFLCPVCFAKNGGRMGTHHILCWKPGVPLSVTPTPGRWQWEGTGLADLTLVAGSSSVLITGEGSCKAHFWVRAGEIVLA